MRRRSPKNISATIPLEFNCKKIPSLAVSLKVRSNTLFVTYTRIAISFSGIDVDEMFLKRSPFQTLAKITALREENNNTISEGASNINKRRV